MKKNLLGIISLVLILTSCSTPILNNTSQYSDLDKEYSQFTTKALTQSYLKKKMDKWLSDGKYSKNLVREIEYAKFKHKDLLKDIVALQPTMFDNITANTAVTTKRVESPFENYIEYINPYPSSVTANSATNITASSFTANWTSSTRASSYKLFVNGSEVYSGANTSFDVTNLSFGTTPTYYVKAVNSAGTSQNSNTISVTLNPDTVTALDATNVTQTSFTANWTSVTGATSYKLKVDSGEFTDVGNITNYSVTGLTSGTTHTYSVQAVNASGTGSSSNTISVTLNIAIPAIPTGLNATNIATTSFTANWTAVSGATSYSLLIDDAVVPQNIGNVTSYTVTALSSGVSHTYNVQAVNSSGSSAKATASVTLNPDTVTALVATNVTQTSFTANWSAVNGATSYKLKIDSGAFTDVGNITSKSITGLTVGTTHTYIVQAVNGANTGLSSNTITVNLNPAIPTVPTGLNATNITTTSFTANWTAVSGATNYLLAIDNEVSPKDVGNVTSYNVTGLSSGVSHTYNLQAVNSSGSSAKTNNSSVTLLPVAPVATSATSITTTSFTANWGAVTGATSYKLKVDSGAYTDVGNITSKSITGLTVGTTHTYIVEAVNAGGTSSDSNTITAYLLTSTPLSGVITFQTNKDGNYEIYKINADGTALTRLTNNSSDDTFPTWSHNGTKIAYIYSQEIYTMNADGSSVTKLTNNTSNDTTPLWKYDDSAILYNTSWVGVWELDMVTISNLTESRILRASGEGEANWYSATKMIFSSAKTGTWYIYSMNSDTSNQVQLTTLSNSWNPRVSPDGTKIVFQTSADGDYEIYTMNINGTNPKRLTNNTNFDECPSWSPDGTRIVFDSDRDGDNEIYVMDATDSDSDGNGDNLVKITNNSFSDASPSWKN